MPNNKAAKKCTINKIPVAFVRCITDLCIKTIYHPYRLEDRYFHGMVRNNSL